MSRLSVLERKELLLGGGLGLIAPVIGALAAGRPQDLDLFVFIVAAVLISVPLLGVGLLAVAMRSWRKRNAAVRWGFRAAAIAELALQLAGEILCFATAHTDAQGAIAFLFAPIYAHVLSAAVVALTMLAVFSVGRLTAARN